MRTMAMMLVEVRQELGVPLSRSKAVKRGTLGAGRQHTLALKVLTVLLPHVEIEVTVEGPSLRRGDLENLLVRSQDLLRSWLRHWGRHCGLLLP